MAGFGLRDYEYRIPCPHCGTTDCCGVRGEELVCIRTKKVVTEQQLLRQATLLNLPRRTTYRQW